MTQTTTEIAKYHKTWLEVDRKISYDEWLDLGEYIVTRMNASVWHIADWLFLGEWTFGSKYKEAAIKIGLEPNTLRNYSYVAGRFDAQRRRANLSFSHHKAVAPLAIADADRWLDEAEQHGWSVKELVERIHPAQPKALSPGMEIVKLSVEPTKQARWNSAAEKAELDLNAWIVLVLDLAASDEDI